MAPGAPARPAGPRLDCVPPVKSSAKLVFGVIFSGGFGIMCTIWGIVTLVRGELLTVVVVLGFAPFCLGLVAQFIILRWGRVTPRGVFDGAGTTIRPDRRVDVLFQVWLLGGVVAMGLFAILAPLGMLDIPVGREQRYSLPFMGAAGAVMGAPMLWRTLRRGSMTYLRLTPTGFEFAQGSSSPCGKWADVKDVTDRRPGQPPPAYSAIVIVMSDGQTPTLAAGSFTPDGQALRELVRFYWQRREDRAELTNGRALERLSNEEFDHPVRRCKPGPDVERDARRGRE